MNLFEGGEIMKTFCPECGFGVKVDVDGCCSSCGCDATGPAVDELPTPCSCRTVVYHKGYICKDCRKAIVEVAKPCIECGETEKHLWGCKIGSMFDTPNIEEAAQLNARKEKIFGLLRDFRYKDTEEEG